MDLLDQTIGNVLARSPVIESAPVGPSQHRYANAALVLETGHDPARLLHRLQNTEALLGRVRRGQRWRARVIDLDIVLWSGGIIAEPTLQIPHPLFRSRDFVLGPAAAIAPRWRDPQSGLTLRHLHARLTGNGSVPR
jgi:2-amino-4-hydroxy-6-hydroxymethyldihydropteridine diphosphokinase